MTIKLRNGIFLAPFHPVDEDPTLCIQRDLELIEHLDRLGYEEAWIGEHHSAGFEIISEPGSSSSPPRRNAPSASGSAPAWSRCPITTR